MPHVLCMVTLSHPGPDLKSVPYIDGGATSSAYLWPVVQKRTYIHIYMYIQIYTHMGIYVNYITYNT